MTKIYSAREVSSILKVDDHLINKLTHIFSTYFSPTLLENDEKTYTVDDIRMIAYILTLWEDQPDIEHIKIGLNSNSQYQHDLIDNLIVEITPFFFEPSDYIDDSWKNGVLFGGLAEIGDIFFLANSYKLAGDTLIDAALKDQRAWELFCPAVYNYRHAIELYLKSLTGDRKKKHDLNRLYNIFENMMTSQFKLNTPEWFKNLIVAINKFDPGGTMFRYGGDLDGSEVFIDFTQLKRLMGWLSHSFQNIKRQQGMQDASF